jgi:hypothetical protein
VTPADRALELVNGFRITQVVNAAAELRIPDLVAANPMTASELAAATGIDTGRLSRLLSGLVVIGVLELGDDGRYSNTAVGELFREGVPGSMRANIRMLVPESYRDWDHVMETLQTGVTGHSLAHGGTLWDSIARDPDFAHRFNAAMASNSERVAEFVASALDFGGARLVVDVGGGKGALAGGILRAHPHLTAVICDVGPGLAEAPGYLADLGVVDRCSFVECDFFASVPRGGDVYLLKDIVHDWDDEHAAAILSVCRRAMAIGARVMIVERGFPGRATPTPRDFSSVMIDLQMMVQLGSRERTIVEYRSLLEGAGLAFVGATPGELYVVVEGQLRA